MKAVRQSFDQSPLCGEGALRGHFRGLGPDGSVLALETQEESASILQVLQ